MKTFKSYIVLSIIIFLSGCKSIERENGKASTKNSTMRVSIFKSQGKYDLFIEVTKGPKTEAPRDHLLQQIRVTKKITENGVEYVSPQGEVICVVDENAIHLKGSLKERVNLVDRHLPDSVEIQN